MVERASKSPRKGGIVRSTSSPGDKNDGDAGSRDGVKQQQQQQEQQQKRRQVKAAEDGTDTRSKVGRGPAAVAAGEQADAGDEALRKRRAHLMDVLNASESRVASGVGVAREREREYEGSVTPSAGDGADRVSPCLQPADRPRARSTREQPKSSFVCLYCEKIFPNAQVRPSPARVYRIRHEQR